MYRNLYKDLQDNFELSCKIKIKNKSFLVKNHFYVIKLRNIKDNNQLTCIWKAGLLKLIYPNKYEEMINIKGFMINHFKREKIDFIELNYHII